MEQQQGSRARMLVVGRLLRRTRTRKHDLCPTVPAVPTPGKSRAPDAREVGKGGDTRTQIRSSWRVRSSQQPRQHSRTAAAADTRPNKTLPLARRRERRGGEGRGAGWRVRGAMRCGAAAGLAGTCVVGVGGGGMSSCVRQSSLECWPREHAHTRSQRSQPRRCTHNKQCHPSTIEGERRGAPSSGSWLWLCLRACGCG